MKKITLLIVLMITLFQSTVAAQENARYLAGGSSKSSSTSNAPVGTAAAEAAESGLKWDVFVGATAVMAGAFGFILYLASTDPTTYGHIH